MIRKGLQIDICASFPCATEPYREAKAIQQIELLLITISNDNSVEKNLAQTPKHPHITFTNISSNLRIKRLT